MGNANQTQPNNISTTLPYSWSASANGGWHAGQPLWPISPPISTTTTSSTVASTFVCVASPCGCQGSACAPGTCTCPSPSNMCGTPGGICNPSMNYNCTCAALATGSMSGNGTPPVMNPESDWNLDAAWNPFYGAVGASPYENYYSSGSTAPATRPSYSQAALASDIRFRILIKPNNAGLIQPGYIGVMY